MNERDIGYFIKTINDKIKIKADADLKTHNLTMSQSYVLTYLARRGGLATQKEIEDFLQVSHPTVVGIVSRLEDKELVSSWMDERDRRNKNVRITEKARRLVDDMTRTIKLQESRMLAAFSPEEKKQLADMLRRIYQNLE